MRNRSNDSNYHWDYQDYRGNYGQSPARARKSSGLKYFLIAMGVVILLVGALCVGASVWGSKPAPQPDQDSAMSWSTCRRSTSRTSRRIMCRIPPKTAF